MHKKRDTLLGLLIIGLFIIAALWFSLHSSLETPKGDVAPTTQSAPPPGKVTESTQFYEITIAYPSQTPLVTLVNPEVDAAAVTLMRTWQNETIATFKTDGNFDHLTPEDIHMQGYDQGRKQALSMEYVLHTSPTTISYVFTIYADTMGAHPNGYFKTFMFDAKNGKPLTLPDLFRSDAHYLETLSSLSRADLGKSIPEADALYVEDGTKPEAESFQNVTIDGDTLSILFPPYQVAPYALGPQEVRIPLSRLSSILKPEYQ